jgi:hypothetical protein
MRGGDALRLRLQERLRLLWCSLSCFRSFLCSFFSFFSFLCLWLRTFSTCGVIKEQQ